MSQPRGAFVSILRLAYVYLGHRTPGASAAHASYLRLNSDPVKGLLDNRANQGSGVAGERILTPHDSTVDPRPSLLWQVFLGSNDDRGSCFGHRRMRPPNPGPQEHLREVGAMFFASVDWADDHHNVAVEDHGDHLVGSTRVPHSPASLATLMAFLLGIAGDPAGIPCFVETNRGLLVSSLLEAGFPVYPVNPRTADRHRKASGAKTDTIDAYLLARAGRSDLADLRRLERRSPVVPAHRLPQGPLPRCPGVLLQAAAALAPGLPRGTAILGPIGGADHAQAQTPRAIPQRPASQTLASTSPMA